MGEEEEDLMTEDLINGRVMELDFLFSLCIKVHSPQGDYTYRKYLNIECQRYREGYMLDRVLSYATRLRSNSLSRVALVYTEIPMGVTSPFETNMISLE